MFDTLVRSQRRVEATLAELAKTQQGLVAALDTVETNVSYLATRLRRPRAATEEDGTPGGSDFVGRVPSGQSNAGSPKRRHGDERPCLRPAQRVVDFRQLPSDGARNERLSRRTMMGDVAPTLPISWPASITLRETLPPKQQELHCLESVYKASRRVASLQTLEDVGSEPSRRFYCTILDPSSYVYLAHSVCSLLVLAYDLNVTPFMIAWALPLEGPFLAATVATSFFWTLDILVSFRTGYRREGLLVQEPRRVARRYARTWLAPDGTMVLCDWGSLLLLGVLGAGGGGGRLSALTLVSAGRLLRVLTLLRAVKFARVLEAHVEEHCSDAYRLTLRILAFFAGTLWLNHLLACAFFLLGRAAPSDTGARWTDSITVVGHKEVEFLSQSLVYQYITSLHYCVSQITLGAIDISSCSTNERVFNIFMLLLGLLFGCTIISSLSATMVEFQMSAKDKNGKLRVLRRYLRNNVVDHRLALLVHQQATERLGKKDTLHESEVEVLRLLSLSLRTKLRFEIFRPHIVRHPLLRFWTSTDEGMVQRFCADCVDVFFSMPQDDIFAPGTMTDTCYFVMKGQLSYTQEPSSSPVREKSTTPVDAGQWLCEAALWSNWIHVGLLETDTECQLLILRADDFGHTLKQNRAIHTITFEYALHFHRCITRARPPIAPWPNDLQVPFTDFGDLIVSMNPRAQVMVGLEAIRQLQAQRSQWRRGWATAGADTRRLQEEVQSGRSVITVGGDGEVERIALVTIMRIEDEDGRVFAQLGKLEGSHIRPGCQLPGAKQEHGDSAEDVVKKLLETRLHPFKSCTETVRVERKIEWRASEEFGVRTKYLRTVCHAKLQESFDAAVMQAETVGCATPGSRARDVFTTRDVFTIRDADKLVYYAWLTQEEFEHLSGAGEAALRSMLLGLEDIRSKASSGSREASSGSGDRSPSPARSRADSSTASYVLDVTPRSRNELLHRFGMRQAL